MSATLAFQRTVTRIALTALEGSQFALAGSGAIREHGITQRPTADVDLFTSNIDPEDFDRRVATVVEALESSGYTVAEKRRAERFARFLVTDADARSIDVDLGVDWREDAAVRLAVGPVLSFEDAIGNKVSALYSRAEARDFLDVDAIRRSGRVNDDHLIRAAAERDAGFEVTMFSRQLDRVARLRPEQVVDYDVDAAALEAVKERILAWAARLRDGDPR